MICFFFPFECIEKGSRVIVWGAGNVGEWYARQIEATGYCNILYWIDKKFKDHTLWNGFVGRGPEAIGEIDGYDYLIIASDNDDNTESIMKALHELGVKKEKIIHRIHSINVEPKLKESYSQYGEDRIIYNAFKHMGFFRDGRLPSYIDLGAHDPYIISNTALFYQFGCRGINIDANPVLIDRFNVERPEDKNLCFGVGKEEGVFPFYITSNNGLNTFKPENISYNEWLIEHDTGEAVRFSTEKVIDIPVYTLTHVIEEYCGGVWPDYMSIDIEGIEYETLECCDLTNGPKLVSVEVNLDGDLFISMMGKKGYFPYLWYRENIIFIRNDFKEMVYEHNPR